MYDGPAFPVPTGSLHRGLNLRDYFAAKAMQAMISPTYDFKTVALMAYQLADKMLEERKKDDGYIAGVKPLGEVGLTIHFEDEKEPEWGEPDSPERANYLAWQLRRLLKEQQNEP